MLHELRLSGFIDCVRANQNARRYQQAKTSSRLAPTSQLNAQLHAVECSTRQLMITLVTRSIAQLLSR